MDSAHDLHFGVFLPPTAAQADQVVTAALEADVLGLDSVGPVNTLSIGGI